MHNSFWGWTDEGASDCTVVGFIGRHTFGAGNISKHTYVVECEGQLYPATHTAVAGALRDPVVKRRVRKALPPRIICTDGAL